MVAVEIGRFIEKIIQAEQDNWSRPLFVTHVSRSDVILAFIAHSEKVKLEGKEYGGALILSGPTLRHTVIPYLVDMIKTYDLPVLHAPMQTYDIMDLMQHFTPKLHQDDIVRVSTAAKHYRNYIDFDNILNI
jgi:BioD-like phosphotransacetylase family protein